jgi:hypothetical protein
MAAALGLCLRRSRAFMISGLRQNFNRTVLATISTSKKNTDSVTISEKYASVSQKDNVPLDEREEVSSIVGFYINLVI